ncbi:MAG: hypothetical protein IPI64_11055 [Chloracidobacterium sp.]|nr:hypothetical protein [Chloracidobacterium sp.]
MAKRKDIWVMIGFIIVFFLLFSSPRFRPLSYFLLGAGAIGAIIALGGYGIVKLTQRNKDNSN